MAKFAFGGGPTFHEYASGADVPARRINEDTRRDADKLIARYRTNVALSRVERSVKDLKKASE